MVSVNLKSSNWKHLAWILHAAIVLFAVPLVFLRLLNFPVDLYSLIFLAASGLFVGLYRKYSSFRIRSSLKTGWALGFILALFIGFGFVSYSLSDSLRFSDFIGRLGDPGVLWRGITVGLAAGIMISTLPFVVVWRSLAGEKPGRLRKFGIVILASFFIGLLSFCYNAGISGGLTIDERVRKNMIAGIPTLLSGNPLAAAIAGTFMAVSEAAKQPSAKSDGKTIIANKRVENGGAN